MTEGSFQSARKDEVGVPLVITGFDAEAAKQVGVSLEKSGVTFAPELGEFAPPPQAVLNKEVRKSNETKVARRTPMNYPPNNYETNCNTEGGFKDEVQF
jgi:hypothetical protein